MPMTLQIAGLIFRRRRELAKVTHPFYAGRAHLPTLVPGALQKPAGGLELARNAEGVLRDAIGVWPLAAVPLHELTNKIVARRPKICGAGPWIWNQTLGHWYG